MPYVRFNGCRICQQQDHKVLSDIDVKLLDGAAIDEIVAQYSSFFTDKQKPLNHLSLLKHRQHLQKQVAPALMGLPPATHGNSQTEIVIDQNGVQTGLDSYVAQLNKNKDILDALIASAMEDVDSIDSYLATAGNAKNQALLLSVRNNIRDSTATTLERILKLITPQISNVGEKNNAQVLELLMIVKKAASLAIKDQIVREGFKKELAIQINNSRELKWLNDNKP